ncbi:MAG: protein jag, partial [Lachnospiraceae bacterium]|nr:protein jag [Lachnospiraceae bacterium]
MKKTFTGDTIEDAITQASVAFGLTSDKLGYEVIDKGAKGFLGLGARKVVIEAWDKEEEEAKKAAEALAEKEALLAEEAGKKAENAAEEARKAAEKEVPKDYGTIESRKNEEERPLEVVPPTEEEIARFETGKKFLEDIFKQMGLEVLVEYRLAPEDTLEINLSGREMGVLIGKRGQTLDSLQYLTNLVVNRGEEKRFHVRVDTENYRARRKETLESLAKNIAYKVKRTRKSMALEPMNAYERRIIHTTLQQDNFVMTKSEGEDPYRHV